jgi:hypothetical protein
LGVSKPPSCDLGHGKHEAVSVIYGVALSGSVVIAKYLFVEVAVKMKWLNRNTRPMQVPLEQAPEVLQPVRVDLPLDVLLNVINRVMHEAATKGVVPYRAVRVDFGAVL